MKFKRNQEKKRILYDIKTALSKFFKPIYYGSDKNKQTKKINNYRYKIFREK